MGTTRSGADYVRRAVANSIKTGFVYTNVPGLAEAPSITQNPTRQTQEPYIYVYSVDSTEADVTKFEASREYTVNVEVCIRYRSRIGGQRQANRMLDEILSIVRGFGVADYPDLSTVGYNIYKITSGDISNVTFKERGANYYKVICPIFVTAQFVGLPGQEQPVQSPSFDYAGWQFAPVGTVLEQYDSGTITPELTYPSGNNGWNFVDAVFTKPASAPGTFVNNVYTVAANHGSAALDSTLNYNLSTNLTETTALTTTTNFSRAISIRYGSMTGTSFTDDTAATTGVQTLSNWVGTKQFIDHRQYNPIGDTLVFDGAEAGDRPYIMYDSSHPPIATFENMAQPGGNDVALFSNLIVGDFRIYYLTNPLLFDGAITYNLR